MSCNKITKLNFSQDEIKGLFKKKICPVCDTKLEKFYETEIVENDKLHCGRITFRGEGTHYTMKYSCPNCNKSFSLSEL